MSVTAVPGMRLGIHLPQYGRAAGAEAIRAVAQHAESVGVDDVWVSDHQVVPSDAPYPPAFLFDPLTALTYTAAVTERIGLGTSVMVLPQHATVSLANSVASLDALSGGRVTLGVGVGWVEREFEALGAEFRERGPRMDEAIGVLRACWGPDPVCFEGRFHRIDGVKLQPKPARPIPIWVGGKTARGHRRAVAQGDGFHALRLTPDEIRPIAKRMRAERPEAQFTISVRVDWDGVRDDLGARAEELAAYAEAGVQHLMAAPAQSTLEGWRASVDGLVGLFR